MCRKWLQCQFQFGGFFCQPPPWGRSLGSQTVTKKTSHPKGNVLRQKKSPLSYDHSFKNPALTPRHSQIAMMRCGVSGLHTHRVSGSNLLNEDASNTKYATKFENILLSLVQPDDWENVLAGKRRVLAGSRPMGVESGGGGGLWRLPGWTQLDLAGYRKQAAKPSPDRCHPTGRPVLGP